MQLPGIPKEDRPQVQDFTMCFSNNKHFCETQKAPSISSNSILQPLVFLHYIVIAWLYV